MLTTPPFVDFESMPTQHLEDIIETAATDWAKAECRWGLGRPFDRNEACALQGWAIRLHSRALRALVRRAES
jgi:hypothetical protein